MKIVQKMIISVISLTAVLGTSAMAADLSLWAESGYQSASEAGLVSYSVVSNNLKDSITRQEFCELAMNLYRRLTNEDVPVPANNPFTDTNSVAVAQAYNYGIVNGTNDSSFTPNRLVTREEMAKMLVSTLTASEVALNIADGTDSEYVDYFKDGDDVSAWAMSSVNTALLYGLITGVTEDKLEPLAATSREQAIVSVNRSYSRFGDIVYSNIELPVISVPEAGSTITDSYFDIKWSEPVNTTAYHVIIKDASSRAVVLKDIDTNHIGIASSMLPNGSYSITVGAVLGDGSEVYSMPVDFTYAYAKNTTSASVLDPALGLDEYAASSASAASAVSSASAYTSSNPVIQSILSTADGYKGTPYVWGGTTPAGFDCSGFVQYVYAQNGISITRTTYTQWDNDGTFVSKANLQPGDLVYFGSGGSPSHVGLYVGGGMMIHSPRTGDVVKYSTIDSGYYAERFLGGKRIVK